MDRFGYRNDVEYALISKSQGRVEINELVDFDEGNGNIYERDNESKGFFVKKKEALEFFGSGLNFWLKQIYSKGVAENVILEKRAKDDTRLDERWRSFPYIYLDPGSFSHEEDKNTCKIKTEEAGLKKIIDSKASDSFDLISTIDSKGNVIPSLSTETVYLEAREILRTSEMVVEDGREITATVSGGDNLNARCFPFEFVKNSDSDNLNQKAVGDQLSAAGGNYANLSADKQQNPFLISSNEKKLIVLNGKVKATIVNAQPGTCQMHIIRYSGGADSIFSEAIPLDSCNPGILGDTLEYTFNDYELEVGEGDWLAIGMLSNTFDGIRYRITETKVEITENSGEFQAPSNAKCLTYKQALNRILYQITGFDNLVKSELLETGILADDLLTNGFYVRQFPDIVNEGTDEERKIQFSTSFQEIIEHIEAMLPIAWWTEFDGEREVFRIEELKYTQQNFIGVPFSKKLLTGGAIYPQASKIKRVALSKNFYSKIELGSNVSGGEYEEVVGLQTICGKAEFSTINDRNTASYSKLSPFGLADYDIEFPRRKPFEKFPDEDTRYDERIMCIRAKKQGGIYVVKKWYDVYESAPTGVYRVNSAYNLELTPAQLLIDRHGYVINSGLYHHPSSNIVFATSNCNSSFISKKPGQDVIYESPVKNSNIGVIPVSRLETPRIKPMSVELTLQVTQEIEDHINGETNGVKNWNGLVAINTGQNIEYFRMVKTDANKEGKHKFIEAFIR